MIDAVTKMLVHWKDGAIGETKSNEMETDHWLLHLKLKPIYDRYETCYVAVAETTE